MIEWFKTNNELRVVVSSLLNYVDRELKRIVADLATWSLILAHTLWQYLRFFPVKFAVFLKFTAKNILVNYWVCYAKILAADSCVLYSDA